LRAARASKATLTLCAGLSRLRELLPIWSGANAGAMSARDKRAAIFYDEVVL
jgi:hypothetical protein